MKATLGIDRRAVLHLLRGWPYLRALLGFLGTGTAHIAQPNVDSSQWIVYVVQQEELQV